MNGQVPTEIVGRPDFAYYYPNPVWDDGDWIKGLILFFDGIGLLVPSYIRDKPFTTDPAIAEGLAEHGLLKIFEPETFIDDRATRQLATAFQQVLDSGALDSLSARGEEFHHLSMSRLGYAANAEIAERMYGELERRGLARSTVDGYSIPMHPAVRTFVLVMWSQILRETGFAAGYTFHPTSDRPQVLDALREILSAPQLPSTGNVVVTDLQTIGIDLGAVPIDEILSFGEAHGAEYREYARELRSFLRDMTALTATERSEALSDRNEKLRDLSADLTRRGSEWRSDAGIGIALTGAVWTAVQGDPLAAVLTAAGLGLQASDTSQKAGAYSYLFAAKRKLGWR